MDRAGCQLTEPADERRQRWHPGQARDFPLCRDGGSAQAQTRASARSRPTGVVEVPARLSRSPNSARGPREQSPWVTTPLLPRDAVTSATSPKERHRRRSLDSAPSLSRDVDLPGVREPGHALKTPPNPVASRLAAVDQGIPVSPESCPLP